MLLCGALRLNITLRVEGRRSPNLSHVGIALERRSGPSSRHNDTMQAGILWGRVSDRYKLGLVDSNCATCSYTASNAPTLPG
jgi:hypothetical protein